MSHSGTTSDPSQFPVLIIDDDLAVLHSLRETLERAGYHIVTCNSPLKALELIRDREFSVVITDMRMPEMTGLEFLGHCEKIQPNATRVLITAVLSLSTVLDAINRGFIYRFIPKPWLHEELLATVENSVQTFLLHRRNRELIEESQKLNEELRATNAELAEKVTQLESGKQKIDQANMDLQHRFTRSLELCWRILNTYDPFLGGRSKQIVELTRFVTDSTQFSENERQVLKAAASLCDLGLLGVSREALQNFRNRPHELTDTDRSLIRNHPIYSQTLAAFVDENAALGETIRAHHEHFDGTGYPDGLSGNTIPWTARCLAVIVAFVESEKNRGEASEYLLKHAGTYFDPDAVRLFIKSTHVLPEPKSVHEVLMDELRPGMTLSRGLYSPTGLLLVAEGQPLTPFTINKIRLHHKTSPITQRLLVYS